MWQAVGWTQKMAANVHKGSGICWSWKRLVGFIREWWWAVLATTQMWSAFPPKANCPFKIAYQSFPPFLPPIPSHLFCIHSKTFTHNIINASVINLAKPGRFQWPKLFYCTHLQISLLRFRNAAQHDICKSRTPKSLQIFETIKCKKWAIDHLERSRFLPSMIYM